MSVNDSNQSNVGLVDLAEALDSQGMIGFTRAFVQDLKKGLSFNSRTFTLDGTTLQNTMMESFV